MLRFVMKKGEKRGKDPFKLVVCREVKMRHTKMTLEAKIVAFNLFLIREQILAV